MPGAPNPLFGDTEEIYLSIWRHTGDISTYLETHRRYISLFGDTQEIYLSIGDTQELQIQLETKGSNLGSNWIPWDPTLDPIGSQWI